MDADAAGSETAVFAGGESAARTTVGKESLRR